VKVRWSGRAARDRDTIFTYLATNNPKAAVKIDDLFAKTAAALAKFPLAGPPGKIPGTRELIPHESYRLVYGVDGDVVWILAIVHTARQWPPERE
jgi:addiction module RelE/StbE family toxin